MMKMTPARLWQFGLSFLVFFGDFLFSCKFKELVADSEKPLKINMEPKPHPIEKEKTYSKPYFLGSMLILQGVYLV